MRKQYVRYDHDKAKPDILFIILSLIAAGGAGFLACLCYFEAGSLPSMTLWVGGTFLVFIVALMILLLLLSMLTRRFKEYVITGRQSPRAVLLPLLGIIAGIAVLAGMFQFVYSLNITPETIADSTSHIYLVDDSGSMDWNDPDDQRYTAIQTLIGKNSPDFPYMIYSFGTYVEVKREMGSANDPSLTIQNTDVGGGTNVDLALSQVYEDYINGVWEGGERPQVVMVTDGESISTSSIDPLLQKYADSNVPISTVHLIAENSEPMMYIADRTGGQFVKVENVNNMNQALETAVNISQTRSLLAPQGRAGGGIIYSLMRILIITLLGCLIGFGALIAYGRHEAAKIMLISTPIKALLAAVAFELLVENLPVLQPMLIIGLFTLLGMSIVAKMKDEAMEYDPDKVTPSDDYDTPQYVGERPKRRRRR